MAAGRPTRRARARAILTADAGVYAPGDTARLLLQAADGDGLLLAGLDGQADSAQVVQIRNGGALALVNIPAYIGEADALTVRFIRFSGTGVAMSPASLRLPVKAAGAGDPDGVRPREGGVRTGERATVRLDARLDSGSAV